MKITAKVYQTEYAIEGVDLSRPSKSIAAFIWQKLAGYPQFFRCQLWLAMVEQAGIKVTPEDRASIGIPC